MDCASYQEEVAHILVDWGSTNFRAYLVSTSGEFLDEKASCRGVKSMPQCEQANFLRTQIDAWLSGAQSAKIILCGMVGSDAGLLNLPMLAAPLPLDEIWKNARRFENGSLPCMYVVPGVSSKRSSKHDSQTALPGMMRGEEIQILGSPLAETQGRGLAILPGTHSKWVSVDAGRITQIRTFATGEIFDLMRTHSSFARHFGQGEGETDEASFLSGIEIVRSGVPLLECVFTIRSDVALNGEADPCKLLSKLSGILIGAELLAWNEDSEQPAFLISEGELGRCYTIAAANMGMRLEIIDARTAFLNGAMKIAANLGAVPTCTEGVIAELSDARPSN